MRTYFNLKTDLKGGDICDESIKYVFTDGKMIRYTGQPRGWFRQGFDYLEHESYHITKSTKIEENPLIFPTGSGMITVYFKSGGEQFHIFGNAKGFINDLESEIDKSK